MSKIGMVKQTIGPRLDNKRSTDSPVDYNVGRSISPFMVAHRRNERGMVRLPNLSGLKDMPISMSNGSSALISLYVIFQTVGLLVSNFNKIPTPEAVTETFAVAPTPAPSLEPIGHLPDGTLLYPEVVNHAPAAADVPVQVTYSVFEKADFAAALSMNWWAEHAMTFLWIGIGFALFNFGKGVYNNIQRRMNPQSQADADTKILHFDFESFTWGAVRWGGMSAIASRLAEEAGKVPHEIEKHTFYIGKFAFATGSALVGAAGDVLKGMAGYAGLVITGAVLSWIAGAVMSFMNRNNQQP